MKRFVPPAGTPTPVKDVVRAGIDAILSNGDAGNRLDAFGASIHSRHVFGVSSGRAGLWLILNSLRRLEPNRNVVAVPAYTCFSIPAAAVRAGLTIHPVDVDPNTLDFDPAGLAGLPHGKLLCVIACNLFGLPSDLSAVRDAAQERGAYVVDDAAQALGATRNGEFAGTLGDVGLYSLGRGKAVGSLEGGLIVTNSDEIAAAIRTEARKLNATSSSHGARLLVELFAYSILLRPNVFWIPNSLPFLKLGTTEFDPSFPTNQMHSFSMALLPRLMRSLAENNEVRRANARAIREALACSSAFKFPTPQSGSLATFVRLPVIARDKTIREQAVGVLRRAGIGASPFYPTAICDIAGIGESMDGPDFHRTKAEVLSETLFTLPVHPSVTSGDVARMTEILGKF